MGSPSHETPAPCSFAHCSGHTGRLVRCLRHRTFYVVAWTAVDGAFWELAATGAASPKNKLGRQWMDHQPYLPSVSSKELGSPRNKLNNPFSMRSHASSYIIFCTAQKKKEAKQAKVQRIPLAKPRKSLISVEN